MLAIAAFISSALRLFQEFVSARDSEEPPVNWVEGVAIMVAIAIVVSIVFAVRFQVTRRPVLRSSLAPLVIDK